MDRQERAGFYAVAAAVSDEVLNEASRFGKELNFIKDDETVSMMERYASLASCNCFS